jgi:TRAP-type C4-dicarboxylate transport system permease small subunit
MIGALAGTALIFGFPIILYNFIFKDELLPWKLYRNYILLIIGAVGGLVAFVFSLMELFDQKNDY